MLLLLLLMLIRGVNGSPDDLQRGDVDEKEMMVSDDDEKRSFY